MSGENENANRTAEVTAWLTNALPRELERIGKKPAGDNGRDWLTERGIGNGQYIFSTKPALERQMIPGEGRTLRERVWACGMLATIGYKGELAVKLVGDKVVPLSASDIRRQINKATEDAAAAMGLNLTKEQKEQLQVDKQHVRRALAQLEADGEALRTLKNGTPLREVPPEERKRMSGQEILLFFFFRPLKPFDPKGSH